MPSLLFYFIFDLQFTHKHLLKFSHHHLSYLLQGMVSHAHKYLHSILLYMLEYIMALYHCIFAHGCGMILAAMQYCIRTVHLVNLSHGILWRVFIIILQPRVFSVFHQATAEFDVMAHPE